jgi:hypothetical protein
MSSGRSTAVDHSPNNPKVKGLSTATAGTGTRGQCYKPFYGRSAQFFVLVCLYKLFQSSSMFAGKAGAYLNQVSFKRFTIG